MRDLLVRHPAGGEPRDPQLRGSQGVDAGEQRAARPSTGQAQLLAYPGAERCHYVPGAKLKGCSITATPGDATDPNLIARRLYDQSYDEWAFIATSSNGVGKDATVNVTIACPTI